MIAIFFTYLLTFASFILSLLLIGEIAFLILKIQIKQVFANLFAKLLLASTLLVFTTAVYYTNGVTVFLFFIPILIMLGLPYFRNKDISNKEEPPTKNYNSFYLIILLFSVGFLFFIFRFGQVYNPYGQTPLVPHGDIVYYANCIDFLIYFGKENSSVDYVYGASLGSSPYHYFELWYGAGISNLMGLNTALFLILVTFSSGIFITWIGFCAILEHYRGKVKLADAVFCFLLVFLTGIILDFYTLVPFMKEIAVYGKNPLNYAKLFPIYLYLIAAVLFFLNKKENEAIYCLLIIPISFISTSFGVFPAIFLWVFIQLITKKQVNFRILILTFLTIGAIFSFYTIFTVKTNTHVNVNFIDIIDKISQYTFLRTAFNIIAGATLQIILIFIPFAILFLLFCYFNPHAFTKSLAEIRIKSVRELMMNTGFRLTVSIYIFSLLAWALLHDRLSIVQVFTNISVTLLNIIAAVSLIIVWVNTEKIYSPYKLTAIIFLLFGISQSFAGYRFLYSQDNDYLEEVTAYSKDASRLGSFIFDEKDYQEIGFSYIANFVIQGSYLIYSDSKTYPLSISPHNFKYNPNPFYAKMEKEVLQNTPFFIYVEMQKKRNEFISIENSQIQFIEEMGVNYLICTKNVVLSKLLKTKIKTEMIDKRTGERFLILK